MRTNKFTALVAWMAMTMAFGLAFVGVAAADTTPYEVPADPTGGAANTLLGSLGDWIQNYAVPMVVGLMIIGLIVGLLIKWGKRATRAA